MDPVFDGSPAPSPESPNGEPVNGPPGPAPEPPDTPNGPIAQMSQYPVHHLSQQDFNNGTLEIRESGYYQLVEDIVFDPPIDPLSSLASEEGPYNLGFFTALSIQTENVYLDLNGHTLKAGERFALLQRFFSLIELANSPFVPRQGPGFFGENFVAAKNVVVCNGKLGRSSHHGIRGNGMENIVIRDLCIFDFEVAALSLQGGKNITLSNLVLGPNFRALAVNGLFSAARFVLPLARTTLRQSPDSPHNKRLRSLIDEVATTLSQVIDEVLTTGATTNEHFRNPSGLPDGVCYGIVLSDFGVVTGEYCTQQQRGRGSSIVVQNVTVRDLYNSFSEFPAFADASGKHSDSEQAQTKSSTVFKDPSGSVLNAAKSFTPLQELQVLLSCYGQVGVSTIPKNFFELVERGDVKVIRGGDSMFHVSKPLTGIRVDCVDGFEIANVDIRNLRAFGDMSEVEYSLEQVPQSSHPVLGGNACGITLSACKGAIRNTNIQCIISRHAAVCGVRTFAQSNVSFDNVSTSFLLAQGYKSNASKYLPKPCVMP